MTVLSRLTKLGMAEEETQGTWLAPAVSIPFNSGTKFNDTIAPLRDESMRASDTILQGLSQGPADTTWDVQVNGYSDLAGYWLKGILGPDTVTAGVSTTLAAAAAAGASSISTEESIPEGSTIMITDTGDNPVSEYAQTGTPSGGGPYTIPLTIAGGTGNTLVNSYASGAAVASQTSHAFAQNRTFSTVWPSWAFTTDDGVDQLGWAGCVMSELAIKIDPKGFITYNPKYTGWPSQTESTFSYAASDVQPLVGWAWTITQNGIASTRGLTMDFTFKRAVEAIHSSDGLQSPREVFAGSLEVDGTYKAIFENDTDITLFKQYLQQPTVHTVTQPVLSGGASLAITLSKAGYTTGERDLTATYTQLSMALSGIANPADTGVASVVLKNFQSASY